MEDRLGRTKPGKRPRGRRCVKHFIYIISLRGPISVSCLAYFADETLKVVTNSGRAGGHPDRVAQVPTGKVSLLGAAVEPRFGPDSWAM